MRQVAEALAAAGVTREAVSLLAALAQEVLHEGWLSVAAALLVRLLQCSHPLAAVRSWPPYTESVHCIEDSLLG